MSSRFSGRSRCVLASELLDDADRRFALFDIQLVNVAMLVVQRHLASQPLHTSRTRLEKVAAIATRLSGRKRLKRGMQPCLPVSQISIGQTSERHVALAAREYADPRLARRT
ncbi:hypothetical protein R69749_07433 [Paraburkholderia domus]|nr:hypothetical protein R69749_07433 [Paraburkholderia domus]